MSDLLASANQTHAFQFAAKERSDRLMNYFLISYLSIVKQLENSRSFALTVNAMEDDEGTCLKAGMDVMCVNPLNWKS